MSTKANRDRSKKVSSSEEPNCRRKTETGHNDEERLAAAGERLRLEREAHEREAFESGVQAGRKAVLRQNGLEYPMLRKLESLVDSLNPDDFDESIAAELDEEVSIDEFWAWASPNTDEFTLAESEFVRGFCEAALCAFEEAQSRA